MPYCEYNGVAYTSHVRAEVKIQDGSEFELNNINLDELTLNDVISGLAAENKVKTNGISYFMLDPVTNQPVDKNVPLAKLGINEGDTVNLVGKGVAA